MNDDKDRWIKEYWTDSISCPICEYIFDVWDDDLKAITDNIRAY